MVGVLGLYPGHKDPEMHVTIVFLEDAGCSAMLWQNHALANLVTSQS